VQVSARCRLAAALAAIALLAPADLRAQGADPAPDPALEAARAAYREGQDYGNAGLWAEAEERFRTSLRLHRSPTTLCMLARAQHQLGYLVEARESYLAFTSEPPTATSAGLVPDALAALAEIDRKVAKVVVVLEPAPVADPEVRVDGVPVRPENLRRTLLFNPGTHEITARAPGRTDARARLEIPEGGSATVTLTLAAVSVAAPVAPVAPPPPHASRVHPLPLIVIGAGAATVVTGIAVGVAGWVQAVHAPTADGPEASSARVKGIAGDVLAGLGLAAAGVGVVLLFVDRGRAQPAPATGLALRADGLAFHF